MSLGVLVFEKATDRECECHTALCHRSSLNRSGLVFFFKATELFISQTRVLGAHGLMYVRTQACGVR